MNEPKGSMEKPDDIKLKSSDHFQLLFDYKIKREGGTANTSQLLLQLDGRINKEALGDYLLSNIYFKQLVEVSLIRPMIGKERYSFGDQNKLMITEAEYDSLDINDVFQDDDIGSSSVKVTLIQIGGKSSILFQFNHVYIDYSGVRNLLRSFNGDEFDFVRQKKIKQAPFFRRLGTSTKLAVQLLKKWYEPKAFIHSKSKGPIIKKYRIFDFDAKKTKIIESKIVRSHHIASISSYMMSAICLGIKGLLLDRGEAIREFVFQQPAELSDKRERPYILGNRFSFYMYRLPVDKVQDINKMQDELNLQTYEQMKYKIPQKFLELESIMGLFPLRFHLWMASLPAKGKLTSFAYTFVGETKIMEEFAGMKVENTINKPPVMRMPPITFGFGYYDKKLRFHMCYDSETISEEEIDLLYARIEKLLLSQD